MSKSLLFFPTTVYCFCSLKNDVLWKKNTYYSHERSISGVELFGGTPAKSSLSRVRHRQIGRGVAGRGCSFDEFGSTWAETVTARMREVDRAMRERGVEPKLIESRQRIECPII